MEQSLQGWHLTQIRPLVKAQQSKGIIIIKKKNRSRQIARLISQQSNSRGQLTGKEMVVHPLLYAKHQVRMERAHPP